MIRKEDIIRQVQIACKAIRDSRDEDNEQFYNYFKTNNQHVILILLLINLYFNYIKQGFDSIEYYYSIME